MQILKGRDFFQYIVITSKFMTIVFAFKLCVQLSAYVRHVSNLTTVFSHNVASAVLTLQIAGEVKEVYFVSTISVCISYSSYDQNIFSEYLAFVLN